MVHTSDGQILGGRTHGHYHASFAIVDGQSMFHASSAMRRWLHPRHPLLNGERAVDLIARGRTEDVLAVIDRLEAGAYL